jgi:16S rRNA C1402 (ribose-2'-O) methylase RsmI
MTKKFEKYYRGVIPEVIERVGEDIVKGEYTIIIDNRAGIGL